MSSPFNTMALLHCFSKHWANLMQCKQCGQLWIVDEWDKYAHLAAFKVASRPEEHEIADLLYHAHERLAVQDAGGYANEECAWICCANKALKGMKVCYRHSR